ncbi:MAG: efflux RND transporter permease subunit [Planctomycetota bacterium]|nr:efflux RND transporter permease subunit [Planctomycetota bacterium]
MKAAVAWAIRQTPAMNTFMVALLGVGIFSGMMLRREEFPRFELEIVLVTVPYPGASPEEVEQGICQKIEEAVRSVDGVKKVTSVAMEGSGSVIVELQSDVPSVQKVLNEIDSEVQRIPSFPDLAEKPEVRQLTMRNPAINVGVVMTASQAADSERQLREVTEQVRDELLMISEISVATIQGEKAYQVDVEIPEATLRKHGLTLTEVAQQIRLRNLELPGGKIRDRSQEYLLRGKNKRVTGAEIAEIPIVTQRNRVALTVADLGSVSDDFEDKTSISRISGQPGLAITIEASAREDLLGMTAAVREYVAQKQLPPGFSFKLWGDTSVNVKDRLDLLKKNGAQGLVLVFFVLALFLELRLAFWVALGIPVAVLGACAVLWQFDQTLNMLSMFAFLIALGIVVDDAIVIGENIYAHRLLGKSFRQAAIDGTVEVMPSVATSVTTTIFAFSPMFFVSGIMGKFFAVLPLAVIAMLVISLVESTLILPCHLAHSSTGEAPTLTSRALGLRRRSRRLLTREVVAPLLTVLAFVADQFLFPFRCLMRWSAGLNRATAALLDFVITRLYSPVLRFCLKNPAIAGATAVAVLIGSLSLVSSGAVPWIVFPKLDAPIIEARIIFPDGTPSEVTDAATQRIVAAIDRIDQQHGGERGLVQVTHRLVGQVTSQAPGGAADRTEGGHAGTISVELIENSLRDLTSGQIVEMWRKETGPIPGVETLSFGSVAKGPGGTPIEFKLLGPATDMETLEATVERTKEKLAEYPGVFDISDDSRPGKWEIQLAVKDNADTLGIPLDRLARTVRAAYYGEEVMRLQRGRHEVKLMVRYPREERNTLASFDEIRVRSDNGIERPITELAEIDVERGYSEINRVNQMRSITVTADMDEAIGNAELVRTKLKAEFLPALLKEFPHVQVRWEGQAAQSAESMQSLFRGFVVAVLVMFGLLTLEFKSYLQPCLVLLIIPFGLVGAIAGHAILGLPLTMFSMFGIVALTGIVVNDSIVLIDFINSRVKAGLPLNDALSEAGSSRFRTVLLTTVTTIGGLLPILLETSFQAQILIPMATSIAFGEMFATALVLYLVPVSYSLYASIIKIGPETVA